MKKIMIIVLFSIFILSCGSEKKENEREEAQNQEDSSDFTGTPPPPVSELQADCVLDIKKIDKSIWVEKGYSIDAVMDSQFPLIDSATVRLLLNCSVLDESKRSTQIEGEYYEYQVNYSYYNIYQLGNYFLLVLLEEIPAGPEYSFIGLTIANKTNKIIDSKYLISVWLDQYEVDFNIELSDEGKLNISKNTKTMYTTEVMDSLEVSNMFYYYEVDSDGFLVETMVDDTYYQCALLDYEKRLLDENGERQNVLFASLPYFDVKLGNFFYSDYPPEGNYDLFTADYPDPSRTINLRYATGGIYGAMGSPFNNYLEIIPGENNFYIVKVEQNYSSSLLFNDDGSGGVYSAGEIESYDSDWIELEPYDENVYATITNEYIDNNTGAMTIQNREKAEEYANSKEWDVNYSEEILTSTIRIVYMVNGLENVINMQFDFEYGD